MYVPGLQWGSMISHSLPNYLDFTLFVESFIELQEFKPCYQLFSMRQGFLSSRGRHSLELLSWWFELSCPYALNYSFQLEFRYEPCTLIPAKHLWLNGESAQLNIGEKEFISEKEYRGVKLLLDARQWDRTLKSVYWNWLCINGI